MITDLENKAIANNYVKRVGPTWRELVREMKVGDTIQVGGDYMARHSAYCGAKAALPEAKFSMKKTGNELAILTRIS